MNVVDSSGWLEYFAKGPNTTFFKPVIHNTEALLVPSICLYEIYKRIAVQCDEEEALAGPGRTRQIRFAGALAGQSLVSRRPGADLHTSQHPLWHQYGAHLLRRAGRPAGLPAGDDVPASPETSTAVYRGLVSDYLSKPLANGRTIFGRMRKRLGFFKTFIHVLAKGVQLLLCDCGHAAPVAGKQKTPISAKAETGTSVPSKLSRLYPRQYLQLQVLKIFTTRVADTF
jgi:hypothetical protein